MVVESSGALPGRAGRAGVVVLGVLLTLVLSAFATVHAEQADPLGPPMAPVIPSAPEGPDVSHERDAPDEPRDAPDAAGQLAVNEDHKTAPQRHPEPAGQLTAPRRPEPVGQQPAAGGVGAADADAGAFGGDRADGQVQDQIGFFSSGRHYSPDDFTRSLIYSGWLALTVSTLGLAIVGWRRRQW